MEMPKFKGVRLPFRRELISLLGKALLESPLLGWVREGERASAGGCEGSWEAMQGPRAPTREEVDSQSKLPERLYGF